MRVEGGGGCGQDDRAGLPTVSPNPQPPQSHHHPTCLDMYDVCNDCKVVMYAGVCGCGCVHEVVTHNTRRTCD